KNSLGTSALEIAMSQGYEDIAGMLLNKGNATVDQQSLITALQENSSLISEVVDKAPLEVINYQDRNGNTPLILATQAGNKTIVEKLLDKKANVNLKTEHGTS